MQIITDNKRAPKGVLTVLATIGWGFVLYFCWILLQDSWERSAFAFKALAGQIPELDPFNDRYTAHPWQTLLHTLTGLVFAVFGPLQFVAPLRRRIPKLHRISGRIFLPAGILSGVGAFVMTLSFPIWGPIQNVFISLAFSAFMVFCFVNAFRLVRQRQFARHREWMIRGFALGVAVGLFRWVLRDVLPNLGIEDFDQRWNIVTATSHMTLLLAAELWIRLTRLARAQAASVADVLPAQVQPGAQVR
jgi:uncharacterized membrane protein